LGFAVRGADRQLHSPFAEHENAARRLTFHEPDCAFGIGGRVLDGFKGLDRCGVQVAQKIRARLRAQAASMISSPSGQSTTPLLCRSDPGKLREPRSARIWLPLGQLPIPGIIAIGL